MSEVSKPTVAVLGTGIIGAPVARNLAAAGYQVTAWNRTSSKVEALQDAGVRAAPTPAEAVRDAKVVITVLKDGPSIDEAIREALPHIGEGVVWLQLSTVGIPAIDELAEVASSAGIRFFDAPVLGTRQPAEQGKLVILASGGPAGRELAQPIFEVLGQRTLWVADAPGASSRLKLALNSYVFALTHATAETLAIAQGLGVDPALAIDALTGGPLDSGYLQGKGGAMLRGDYTTSFSVENARKDAQLVADAVEGTDVHADLALAGLARFERLVDRGFGEDDIAASIEA